MVRATSCAAWQYTACPVNGVSWGGVPRTHEATTSKYMIWIGSRYPDSYFKFHTLRPIGTLYSSPLHCVRFEADGTSVSDPVWSGWRWGSCFVWEPFWLGWRRWGRFERSSLGSFGSR